LDVIEWPFVAMGHHDVPPTAPRTSASPSPPYRSKMFPLASSLVGAVRRLRSAWGSLSASLENPAEFDLRSEDGHLRTLHLLEVPRTKPPGTRLEFDSRWSR